MLRQIVKKKSQHSTHEKNINIVHNKVAFLTEKKLIKNVKTL